MQWFQLGAEDTEARREAIAVYLATLGIPDAEEVARPFAELVSSPTFALGAGRVAERLSRVGSPRHAMLTLLDCIRELEVRRGDGSTLLVGPILDIVLELGGSSRWASRQLARDPALAIELGLRMNGPRWMNSSGDDFVPPVLGLVESSGGDVQRFDQQLRRFRNRQMLRIALLELRDADVRYTSALLADLASAAFEAALSFHRPLLEAEVGVPEPPCEMVVMGMGKLGGRELNFASDVDVIYVYEHDEGRAGELSLHPFFVKLCERVTSSVARITDHGFVFRVDLDLRPEGRRGPLANSLIGVERYYETWGRTWERAAWVKARPVAGSAALGEHVQRVLRPFIYPSARDYTAIEEMLAMKAEIDRQQRRASLRPLGGGLDLKLGRGGIREVEFFVQAHQLLYGGREPRLRKTSTLDALFALEVAGHVNARLRHVLADAYHFLRRVEHRLQIVNEQQTHTFPKEADARTELARSLGFEHAVELERVLHGHMTEVRTRFETLLGTVEAPDEVPDAVALLVDTATAEVPPHEALARLGAQDPHAAAAHLEAALRLPQGPLHPNAPSTARRRGLLLLAECVFSPSVDRALKHLPGLLRTLLDHQAYLAQLDDPRLRRGVARVLGASDLLARILVSTPALLPQVFLTDPLPDRAALEADLSKRLEVEAGALERSLEVLRSFQQTEVLRVAIADLAQELEWAETTRFLSDLAEVLIGRALRLSLDEQTFRYGGPEDPAAGLGLVAGGTLGARELGYRSDVDLSVLFRGRGETRGGVRGSVSVGEFFTRVTQRVLSFLSMRMPSGVLYTVDVRLRPSGSQGALVASLDSFGRYHRGTAQLWERQVLLRSRPIGGDPELQGELRAALETAAYRAPVGSDAAEQIRDMRVRRAREQAGGGHRASGRTVDLKLGRGGLVELEFLVQYLQIRHGVSEPAVRTTSTRDALAALGRANIIPASSAQSLIGVHDRLRRLVSWLRVAHDEMLDHVALRPDNLRPLALTLGYEGTDAHASLERALEADRDLVHDAYARWLT